ncbi:hypothetical protein DAPPUDRAFT_112065 [Daphnia pulex]|uniref:Uncharacterized protein n=1 Tax=Daphnia pulex TaxID=6669 RepID=E9HAV3_DAPPU|nr:hypothetical protein DAPPUDRAFT_112065 [Daphnia pulex]|eukprot:EFX71095.1 hypothetical protein DAPPUDRAFT_112065 [Daphnia pulex]
MVFLFHQPAAINGTSSEAKVESDAPPAVITTQPAQPMPEHDDSIAVVMWEATVTGRRLIDEMEEKAEGHDFNEYVMPYGKLPLNALERYRLLDDVNKILLGCVNGWDLLRQQPDKPVRRGSGRRAPRTRSLCTATDLEKQQPASKIEPEENNNDPVKVIMDVIPSTPAVLSEV